jgi:hypothetical protein
MPITDRHTTKSHEITATLYGFGMGEEMGSALDRNSWDAPSVPWGGWK